MKKFIFGIFLAGLVIAGVAQADSFGGGNGGGSSSASADGIYAHAQRNTSCVMAPMDSGAADGTWMYPGWSTASATWTAGTGVSNQPSANQATTYAMGYATSSVSGATSGPGVNLNPKVITRFFAGAPAFSAVVFSDATTSRRIWVAITDTDLTAVAPPTGSVANTSNVAGWAYDPAVSANWLYVTSNATSWSGTDSGIAFTANTVYSLVIDLNTGVPAANVYLAPYAAGSINFQINGVKFTKTTLLPLASANVPGAQVTITTTTTAVANLYVQRICASRF